MPFIEVIAAMDRVGPGPGQDVDQLVPTSRQPSADAQRVGHLQQLAAHGSSMTPKTIVFATFSTDCQ